MNCRDDDEVAWRSLDWLVLLLAILSLTSLIIMLASSSTEETAVPRTAPERALVLGTSSLLFVISIFASCYVSQRLGLTCCDLCFYRYYREPATEHLTPWQQKNLRYKLATSPPPPPRYDTFINMVEPNLMTQVNIPVGVHELGVSSSGQRGRASTEQGSCYQNLRPQADNG